MTDLFTESGPLTERLELRRIVPGEVAGPRRREAPHWSISAASGCSRAGALPRVPKGKGWVVAPVAESAAESDSDCYGQHWSRSESFDWIVAVVAGRWAASSAPRRTSSRTARKPQLRKSISSPNYNRERGSLVP